MSGAQPSALLAVVVVGGGLFQGYGGPHGIVLRQVSRPHRCAVHPPFGRGAVFGTLMNLSCPSCSETLREDKIDDQGVASCRRCRAWIRLERRKGGWSFPALDPLDETAAFHVQTDRPRVFGHRDEEKVAQWGHLDISRHWFHPRALLGGPFLLCWLGFLIPMTIKLFVPGQERLLLRIGVFITMLPHWAIGIFGTWYVLTLCFNRTRIVVRDGQLNVTAGRIRTPFIRDCVLPLSAISGFEIAPSPWQFPRPRFRHTIAFRRRWDVVAETTNGETFVVVAKLDEDNARYALHRLRLQLPPPTPEVG